MEQTHQIEEVMSSIRKMPIYRQLIPLEAGIGWPIPLRRDKKVYVTFPFFGQSYHREQQQTALFPPFATLTLNWTNLMPVEYVSLPFHNPWPEGRWNEQAGTFPHPAVVQLGSIANYKQKREELLNMYNEMLDNLASGTTFSEAWTQQFSSLLRLLLEPGLEPFYRVLAPKFFDRFLPTTS